MWLFIVLVAIPIIEIAFFIELGGAIGLWPTLGLVIATALLGGFMLRAQGFATLERLRVSLEAGADPRGPLGHGVLILAAGLLMLTPGFFTDTFGFLLLVPPLRAALIQWIGPLIASRMTPNMSKQRESHPDFNEKSVDAEYVDMTDVNDNHDKTSGWTRRPPEE